MNLSYHTINKVTCFLLLVTCSFSQSFLNPNPTKTMLAEREKLFSAIAGANSQLPFQLSYNQYFYYNKNLPNLENHNGLYFPKGVGSISSLLMHYKSKHLIISVEPYILDSREYSFLQHVKKSTFSVLNDVPLENKYRINSNKIRNAGLIFYYSDLSLGYGNWDQWWGPGIHNSLVMSNNAEGISHYFVGTLDYKPVVGDLKYYYKYMVSEAMHNNANAEYFLSAYFFNLRYKNIELGASRHILNGGHSDLSWSLNDAMNVLFTKKNMKYWDEIIDYYISAIFPSSGLKVFLEVGYPNHSLDGKDPEVYYNNTMGSNLGLRKYGAFGYDELMFGFEYTRLVQGIYYNILPTPNWYDNIKYNYSSYNGRRWAAHSGTDSDDFLIFIGYMDDRASIVYGLNYERHGVTYHFPPEVKLESRISASFKYKNTFIYFNYENEYFEHYRFVDVNSNVWEEVFEPGSIQRTQTLLISIEHTFSF